MEHLAASNQPLSLDPNTTLHEHVKGFDKAKDLAGDWIFKHNMDLTPTDKPLVVHITDGEKDSDLYDTNHYVTAFRGNGVPITPTTKKPRTKNSVQVFVHRPKDAKLLAGEWTGIFNQLVDPSEGDSPFVIHIKSHPNSSYHVIGHYLDGRFLNFRDADEALQVIDDYEE